MGTNWRGKDDNDNTLIISSLTSLTMPSAYITGDFNFGTQRCTKVPDEDPDPRQPFHSGTRHEQPRDPACTDIVNPWGDLMAPSVQTIPRGLELYEVTDH